MNVFMCAVASRHSRLEPTDLKIVAVEERMGACKGRGSNRGFVRYVFHYTLQPKLVNVVQNFKSAV